MIVVRKGTLDDAEIISDFQIAMALETESLTLDKSTVLKGVKAVFELPAKGQYFVAVDKNKVVGSLMITYEWSDWRNQWVWWIQSVYILPAFRGKKIFSRMYNHIKTLVINNDDVSGIRLYVDLTNSNARKVYQSLGMNGEHYQLFEWMKGE